MLRLLKKTTITIREEFELCLSYGVNPLFWHRFIKLDVNLRISLQNELFGKSELGKGNVVIANDRYYHYCFDNSLLVCENCGTSFFVKENIDGCYSSRNVSHIISRGARADLAHDPRNHNMLCGRCHSEWENGNKQGMLIYMDNMVVVRELNNDYRL